MTKISALATILALAGTASFASAAVVFRDDFEGFSVGAGAFPNAGSDLDPVASVGTWVQSESVNENAQVTRSFSPVQGNQALGLGRYDLDPGEAVVASGGHITAAQFVASPLLPTDPLKITFKYKDPTPNPQFSNSVDRMNLIGQNRSGVGFGQQVFNINFTSGWNGSNLLTLNFGSKSLHPEDITRADFNIGTFETDWIDVEMLMNFVTHTYTVSINGVSVPNSTNIPFDGDAAGASTMQQLMFYNEYPVNTVFAIDDLTIQTVPVPEPTSAVVLALGGLAAIGRRRRSI